jgi:hypothetical protein
MDDAADSSRPAILRHAMTRWIAQPFAALILTAVEASAAVSPVVPLATFQTERAAQDNCPNGIVIWVDPHSRTYYYRGQNRYGSTKGGAFACRDDANRAGLRKARGSR